MAAAARVPHALRLRVSVGCGRRGGGTCQTSGTARIPRSIPCGAGITGAPQRAGRQRAHDSRIAAPHRRRPGAAFPSIQYPFTLHVSAKHSLVWPRRSLDLRALQELCAKPPNPEEWIRETAMHADTAVFRSERAQDLAFSRATRPHPSRDQLRGGSRIRVLSRGRPAAPQSRPPGPPWTATRHEFHLHCPSAWSGGALTITALNKTTTLHKKHFVGAQQARSAHLVDSSWPAPASRQVDSSRGPNLGVAARWRGTLARESAWRADSQPRVRRSPRARGSGYVGPIQARRRRPSGDAGAGSRRW